MQLLYGVIFILNYFYSCYRIHISFNLVVVLHVMEVCGNMMVFSIINSRLLPVVHFERLYIVPVHVIVNILKFNDYTR